MPGDWRADPWIARVVALVVAIFGFLPLTQWIAGGYGDPIAALRYTEWATGTAIALGGGAILALVTRRRPLASLAPASPDWARLGRWLPLLAVAIYAAIALAVFDGRPLLYDEIVQVLQARIFAGGRVWDPSPVHREFFEFLHMVNHEGRVFAHFPPGGPATLALGVLVGATWLVGPVAAAISVALFLRIARRAEPRPGVAFAAALLFAIAPFNAFMSGSHMNHVTTLTFTLVGVLGMLRAMESERPRPLAALASGLGFGIAATIRPLDTLAYALPAGLWFLVRALREPRRWADALVAAAGIAIPASLFLWYNAQTTGDPLLLGYTVLWGAGHGVGFHQPPWGEAHTPMRGLELMNMYWIALQGTLFETIFPALLPVIGGLALTRRLRAADRYLLASAMLLTALYWAYWGEGYFLGPRFLFSLVPVIVLWAARFPALLHERTGDGMTFRVVAGALVTATVVAAVYGVPTRWRQYQQGFAGERFDVVAEARRAGARDAIVFVREEWDMQLLARMWALDISHRDAEVLHSQTDACVLERALARVERDGLRADAAAAVLLPLTADRAKVETKAVASGANLRVVPGTPYTPRCSERLSTMQEGVMSIGVALLAQGRDGNIYARELRDRNAALLREHPQRSVWLLAPAGPSFGVPPRFRRLDRDSLATAWAATMD